jgi:hypothetical protein
LGDEYQSTAGHYYISNPRQIDGRVRLSADPKLRFQSPHWDLQRLPLSNRPA